MDRELKFRAWHIEQKRMIEVYGLGKDFITENTLDGVDPGTNAFCGDDMNFLKVMQYTGLNDKNGTEIYESDLLKILHGDPFAPETICVVVSTMGSFGVYPIDKETDVFGNKYSGKMLSFYPDYTPETTEIIGNIHQNPELLTPTIKK